MPIHRTRIGMYCNGWGREEVGRTCPAAPPPPGQEISSPPTAAAAVSTPAACSVVSVRASASSDARCGAALCARRVLIYGIPTRIHKPIPINKLTRTNKKPIDLTDPQRWRAGSVLGKTRKTRRNRMRAQPSSYYYHY